MYERPATTRSHQTFSEVQRVVSRHLIEGARIAFRASVVQQTVCGIGQHQMAWMRTVMHLKENRGVIDVVCLNKKTKLVISRLL